MITLGIIGVVAAMTIPTLMAKINERQTVTKLKKAYSTLANAMRILEHDEDIDWNSCPTLYTDEAGRNECDQKLATTMKATYKSYPSGVYVSNTTGLDVKTFIQTMDGVFYYIAGCGLVGGLYVDINGQKGPNRGGKDVFQFVYSQYDNNGQKQLTYRLRPATPYRTCTKTNYSNSCTAQVLQTGKIDWLK